MTTEKRKKVFIIIGIALFAGLMAFLFFFLGSKIPWEMIWSNMDQIEAWVAHHYLLSALIFMGMYIVFVSLYIPGSTAIMVIGGILFGIVFGTVYIVIAGTIGAVIVFSVSRTLLSDRVEQKFPKKFHKFNDEITRYGTVYLLAIRSVVIFPFFLVNLFSGVTKIQLKTFIWTTALGIIPLSAIYAYLGYAGKITMEGGKTQGLPYQFYIGLVLLSLLILAPMIFNRVKNKTKNDQVMEKEG